MERNTSFLKCASHDMNLLPVYCEDCECPVCTKCITSCHMKHNVLDVSTYVSKQKDELMASMQEDYSQIEKIRSELTEMKTSAEERKNQLLEEVSRREDAIIAEVKDIAAGCRNILTEAALQQEQKIEQHEVALHNISELPELKLQTEEECIEFLHCRSEIRRLQREIKDHDSVHITFEATKDLSKTQIEEIFGSVSVDNDVHQSSDDDRLIEKKWPSHSRNIESMLKATKRKLDKNSQSICILYKVSADRIPNDCKGIFFSDEKKYLYLDKGLFVKEKESEVYEVLKNVQHCTEHSSENGLLVVTENESVLGLFFRNGNYIVVYKISNSDGKIVDVVENAKTGIIVLLVKAIRDTKGYFVRNEVSLLEVNINGVSKKKSWMQLENYITLKLKICILNDTKQIVFNLDKSLFVYSQQLNFKFRYSGCRGDNPSSWFSASSVSLDTDDNILVSDSYDNTIHMLSIDGKFLKIIVWPEDDVLNAQWLSVDTDGWIWIGQGGRSRSSDFCVFDYDYLKKTERTERALTETEEEPETL